MTGDRIAHKLTATFYAVLCFMVLTCSVAWGSNTRYEVSISDSPQLGPPNAPITMIEFIDFQ